MGVCAPKEHTLIRPLKGRLIPISDITSTSRLDSILNSGITNNYEFIKVIGYGQFGTVREAVLKSQYSDDTLTQKHFAIKSISKNRVKEYLSLLQNELSILQLVDHPNIIRLYEVYEDSLYIHLVTELCTGGDLYEHLISKETLNETEVANILQKLLHSVNHLHIMHICHRDLKPENVLLLDKTSDAELKLIDFGLSVKYNEEMMESMVGTPYYLAPEILKGSYNKACDV